MLSFVMNYEKVKQFGLQILARKHSLNELLLPFLTPNFHPLSEDLDSHSYFCSVITNADSWFTQKKPVMGCPKVRNIFSARLVIIFRFSYELLA